MATQLISTPPRRSVYRLIDAMPSVLQIIIPAFLLDCVLGDPQNPVHPIRLIGLVISCGVNVFQGCRIKSHKLVFMLGMLFAIVIVLLVYSMTACILAFLCCLGQWLGYAAEIVLCYFLIAPRALYNESMRVYESLQNGDICSAKTNLSMIVGRDTENLGAGGIVCATVETVAENFSDGVIAPLFYVAIGGVPLGFAYKAVNTLDSMIGYRNETYEYFGKFAARLDDVANYVPARVSALLMIAAACVMKSNGVNAIRIYFRDNNKHKSPNAAQTEAVCAGALGVQLGGDSHYGGKLVPKPTIGDFTVSPKPSHIIQANRLMYTATVIGILAMLFAQVAWRFSHV